MAEGAAQGAAPVRRTQSERRAATESKLIEATVEALIEVGYYRTSVKEICSRAGVSHGGLFGRFASRLDLIVAAAVRVGERQVEHFAERYAKRNPRADRIETFVRLVRDTTRLSENAVWLELLSAARTDDELRVRLAPEATRYYEHIFRQVHHLDIARDFDKDDLDRRVARLLHAFDGEAIAATVTPDAEREEQFLRDQIAVFRQ
jgi:AcrR family transcriptional regulator